jgi:hypothetical protein
LKWHTLFRKFSLNFDNFYSLQHVGWWSPTIVRGEDREAVHIPNHKFTVNVVRNLSQKSHWRIKTHLAISHLDVNKINVRSNLHYLSFHTYYSCFFAAIEFLFDFLSMITLVCLLFPCRVLSLTCGKSWQRIHKLSNRGCTEECFWKMLILKTRLFWLVLNI